MAGVLSHIFSSAALDPDQNVCDQSVPYQKSNLQLIVWQNIQENPTHRGFDSTRKVIQGKAAQASYHLEDNKMRLSYV